jgi:hypothetical protein
MWRGSQLDVVPSQEPLYTLHYSQDKDFGSPKMPKGGRKP